MQTAPHSPGPRHRPRRACWSRPNQLYHLRVGTHGGSPVFADFAAARSVIRCLRSKDEHRHATSAAFVVMPDHVHWLCFLGGSMSLSRLVASLKADISAALRERDDLPRPLWQFGFFNRSVGAFEDSAEIARSILLDPVRAGLVRTLHDYPHWGCIWVR